VRPSHPDIAFLQRDRRILGAAEAIGGPDKGIEHRLNVRRRLRDDAKAAGL
jgi:hypothetical protein